MHGLDVGAVTGFYVIAVGAWLVRTIVVNLRQYKLARMQADLQGKLAERFGTAEEALAYLNSDAGRRLLAAPLDPGRPSRRILAAVQAGVALLVAGLAFLAVAAVLGLHEKEALVLSGLAIALGLGFLASGLVARRLAGAWDLIEDGRDR